MTAKKFHEKCDLIGRNVVVIKSKYKNLILGGYALHNWGTASCYDMKSFVFSLTNKTKHCNTNGSYVQ